jgi:hypothetical protein
MKTAVEWLLNQIENDSDTHFHNINWDKFDELINQAKEMESKQLFLASNTSAKDAYKAGQASMYCGCYEYDGCTTYEEWLYENFKSE